MTSEFDKLLKLVNKMNEKKGEKCLICHFPDSDNNLIKLSCNHYFHSECIPVNNKLLNYIICPYCDQKSPVVEQVKSCPFIISSGVNKGKVCNRLNCKYHKKFTLQNKCKFILKSGLRKGEECNRLNCKYHKEICLEI